jgi:hypothetical protein
VVVTHFTSDEACSFIANIRARRIELSDTVIYILCNLKCIEDTRF